MGQFSYECSKCGHHDQFDWMDECVVKVGDKYVLGVYDGYGGVEIEVKKPKDDTNGKSILAYHQQFKEYFDSWGVDRKDATRTNCFKDGDRAEALFATEIYCHSADSTPPPSSSPMMMMKSMQRSRAALLGMGPDADDCDECRVCFSFENLPDLFLTEEDIALLPKTHEVKAKLKKKPTRVQPARGIKMKK